MKNALAVVALVSGLPAASLAAGPPTVPAGLLACAKISDVGERVRCYDAQVAAMKQGSAAAGQARARPSREAPAVAAAPAEAPAARAPLDGGRTDGSSSARTVPVEASAAEDNAGGARFGEEQLPISRQPRTPHSDETLSSSITGLTKVAPGVYYFSLANGQIWREEGSEIPESSEIKLLFRVGAPIRIERGALGSYHMWTLAAGAKAWMYVRRIR